MECPCNSCDKADLNKSTVLKCSSPCTKGRRWYLCEQQLLDLLTGRPLDEVIKEDN